MLSFPPSHIYIPPPLIAVFIHCFPSSSPFIRSLLFYQHSPSLPISFTCPSCMSPSPPPPCSPQVSSSLHPSSSCLIKAPHKGVGQINWQPSQPLCWHELDSTLINGNGSAVTRPLVVTLVFVFVTAPHGRTDLVWMQRCLFNAKHNQCHIIDLVTPLTDRQTDTSPNSPSHFILPSFSLCFTQSWPFLQWQLWEVILPLLLHLFPTFLL